MPSKHGQIFLKPHVASMQEGSACNMTDVALPLLGTAPVGPCLALEHPEGIFTCQLQAYLTAWETWDI